MDKHTGIYKITNTITGDFYIGQSVDINRRFVEHFTPKAFGHSSLFSDHIKTYGRDNFSLEIIELCNAQELNEREWFYICKEKPTYNSVIPKRDKFFCEKVRAGTKKWWHRLPEETKRKIITNNLKGPPIGHMVSDETKMRLRQANIGKKQSEEIIEKRKATMARKKADGYVQTNAHARKKVICIENGKLYESVKSAADELKVDSSNISANLKGRQGSVKGFHFEYLKV